MNKLLTLLVALVFLSCSKSANIDTPIVQAHILNLEKINNETPIIDFLGGVPYQAERRNSIGAKETLKILDNRLIRYHNIVIEEVRISLEKGRITEMEIKFFKNPKEENSKNKKEEESEEEERIRKMNIDASAIRDILTKQLGESKESRDGYTHTWMPENEKTLYNISTNEDSYKGANLTIEFNITPHNRYY